MAGTRREFIKTSVLSVASSMMIRPHTNGQLSALITAGIKLDKENLSHPVIMDMVHHNPGLPRTESKFLSPEFLKTNGYDAKVFFLFEAAQFGVNWQKFDPGIFTDSSEARKWVEQNHQVIGEQYTLAKAAGLAVYCMLDMLVFPRLLVEKHRAEMCTSSGKIDIHRPFTKKAVSSLMDQMFETFPQLDGLVIRTGETYLHDAPYYVGGSPVISGMQDHVALLQLLRANVCERWNKKIYYRTWDFGQFHSLPQYYLQVANAITPHPNLFFSIKHTMVDFWRMGIARPQPQLKSLNQYWLDEASRYGVPFNPCLGLGQHKQIVEVQCQREYEGKAAHPNYIAAGVINRFKELEGLKAPQSLGEFKHHPLYAGVWTWSRGGGWGGPYVRNEFWPELNAYVMAHWAKHPNKSEERILESFALLKGLPKSQFQAFHRLCLLSLDGVMKGKYSMLGNVYVNWTRDDSIWGLPVLKPYFDSIINNGQVEEYLKEKQEAAKIWQEIVNLSEQLHFAADDDTHFVQASCRYGHFKFAFYAAAWHVMLKGYEQSKHNKINKTQLQSLINAYDSAWRNWEEFTQMNPYSPTIDQLNATLFGKPVGIQQTVDEFRKQVA